MLTDNIDGSFFRLLSHRERIDLGYPKAISSFLGGFKSCTKQDFDTGHKAKVATFIMHF